MAEQPREIQVQLPTGFPPHPATYASLCIVNRVGQTIFLDFGYIDPLTIGAVQSGTPLRAAHVGRVVMAEDAAIKLRDDLNRLLGGK
jgi:hypothetical protein